MKVDLMLKAMLTATAVAMVLTASAAGNETSTTANACALEANAGHETAWRLEPSLRSAIEGHRARMSEICMKLAAAESKDELLADCLTEAARGPRHIQRGRNMDRGHIARQQELCRKLAS